MLHLHFIKVKYNNFYVHTPKYVSFFPLSVISFTIKAPDTYTGGRFLESCSINSISCYTYNVVLFRVVAVFSVWSQYFSCGRSIFRMVAVLFVWSQYFPYGRSTFRVVAVLSVWSQYFSCHRSTFQE